MLTEEQISNRRLVIETLRTNPGGYNRITGDLWDGDKGCCPLGVACFALGIDPAMEVTTDPHGGFTGPYRLLAAKLGLTCIDDPDFDTDVQFDDPIDEINRIYTKNDSENYSYASMADYLEEWWFPSHTVAL